ncbi:MAG: DNA polymerase domain-containing protein [Candidatus Nitrosocosmicus sp.]|nr:DNA polymerase domain-containing protein [Candidatus Nitrosocosmicus sp.]
MNEILQYRLTIGWYTKGVRIQNSRGKFSGTDSDLKIIDDACKFYDISSIVAFDRRGVPYIRGHNIRNFNIVPAIRKLNKFDYYYHIDLYNIYKKKMVMDIYHDGYRDWKLDTVSKSILGKGKYDGQDGTSIQLLTKEKQLEYVIKDASLVMELSKHNDYEIPDLMNAISVITKVPFDRVCNNGLSSWWTRVINDKINSGKYRLPTLNSAERKKHTYKGGEVLEPKPGYYDAKNNQVVYIFDAKSLYPTMMIKYNISFDTVNCVCCKDKPEAKVPKFIMDLIVDDKKKEQTQNEKAKQYWICQDPKYRGLIPILLEQYREERFRQKDLGNESMQRGLKILINGCDGLFGSEFFEFADYRVAELTTAYGRYTLSYMKHIAEKVYGFDVIAGDTDSIFVTNVKNKLDISKFLAECSILLEDIEIDLVKEYNKALLLGKKHYIGIHQDKTKDPDIVGIEGKKSDRPKWINNLQKDFAEDLKYDRNPTIKLRKAYQDMEKGLVPHDLLAISLTLKQDPSEYDTNDYQNIVGKQLNAKEGDTIKYYKANFPGKAHSDPAFIDRSKYLERLQSTFEKQIKCLGYNYYKHVKGDATLDDFWE